jgi:septum formation topological specificity factor MinE
MSQTTYPALAEHLRRRLEIIADQDLRENAPDTQLKQLQEVSEKIIALHQEMKVSGIHAQLDHFLKNCSFDKALAFVEKPTP